MKHIFRKNQVIITALAIMIAVAGYLQFNQDKVADYSQSTTETVQDAASVDGTQDTDITDETTAATTDVQADVTDADAADAEAVSADSQVAENDETTVVAEDVSDETVAVSDTGELVADTTTEDNAGEAVLVNNTISADFFESAKLQREQTRAKNKETLMGLVDDNNITEAQKEDAVNGVIALTTIADKESATEILLQAKGFEDVVVSIVDDSVDVIVNADQLTQQQIAQIEDIVKRKTAIDAKNIVISPVGVEAQN